MFYRNNNALATKTSLLGFGAMRLPLLEGSNTAVDQKLTEKMVEKAINAGVNYFDTAFTYHNGISELLMGRILSKYPRDSFYLANKMPIWSLKSIEDADKIFAPQLKKCRVQYFDFYLLHGLNVDLYKKVKKIGLYDWLIEKKEQGLVKNIGFSFHDSPELFQTIVDNHTWDFAQIQLNYVDWDALNAKKLYEILEGKQIPAVVMEPVRGGSLANLPEEATSILKNAGPNKSIASWAIRYVASLPNIAVVLSGMSNEEQMDDNISTMKDFSPLSSNEYEILKEVAAIYSASGDIACTGCKYCTDCPQGIDIPAIFSAYNHRKLGNFKLLYPAIPEKAQAHNCVQCGYCVEHCPQKIDVPSMLEKVVEYNV